MPHAIRIDIGEVSLVAELNDSPTATDVLAHLPIEGTVSRWGEEFYFGIPVEQPAGPDARDEFDVGELGYWPPGNAFCIFFGPTPASSGDEPKMANPGNPIGRILDDVSPLKGIADGAHVAVVAD